MVPAWPARLVRVGGLGPPPPTSSRRPVRTRAATSTAAATAPSLVGPLTGPKGNRRAIWALRADLVQCYVATVSDTSPGPAPKGRARLSPSRAAVLPNRSGRVTAWMVGSWPVACLLGGDLQVRGARADLDL